MTLKALTPKRWKKVYLHRKVESTNLLAEELIEKKTACGIIIAEEQSAGRGSNDKSWYSPAGKNLYISFFGSVDEEWTPRYIPQHAALAVFNTIKHFAPDANVCLKWPNDILIGKKKIAGILGKLISVNGEKKYIIGIGINIETPDAAAFSYIWTPGSIEEATGTTILRKDVATFLAQELDRLLSTPLEEITTSFKKEISWMINRKVSCSLDGKTYFVANILGFPDDAGEVSLLKHANAEMMNATTLSIKKIF